ncbi:UbiX family flavin prenyltransferase [Tumebacillus flagellatus]|uniref:Flavin prenyltransferase UbiX n=1 Tax=Tumebacillus flagellatus TaxID=1157490 RepID=A0A074LNK5_9BACL|nr:flavin prenyltransferase UbiX [Tumebacillus flagellatus]KEO83726.1 aromatic acid decarboxylase [Tumebacillus flagellatus]
MNRKKEIVVGMTGASGAVYAIRLVQELCQNDAYRVHLVLTDAVYQVFNLEMGWPVPHGERDSIPKWFGVPESADLHVHAPRDYGAPIASGSHLTQGMIVIPCSMGTLSAIASGASDNLLERAADTHLKEGRPLILVPRETPFNKIHLKNMLACAEAGARIVPAMPGFYHRPETMEDLIDFVVGKALDALGVEHSLFRRWGDREQE